MMLVHTLKAFLLFVMYSCHAFAEPMKIMTYNILSDNYLACGGFDKMPRDIIAWESRQERLLEKITEFDADIVCLQEVEGDAFTTFDARLKVEGYSALDGGVEPDKDRVAIFYKKDKLKLNQIHIKRYPNSTKSFLAAQLQNDIHTFWVINTKAKWSNEPLFERNEGAKQIKYLSEQLHFAQHSPIVLCGDLNVTPDSHWLDALKSSFYDPLVDETSIPQEYAASRVDYILATSSVVLNPIIPEIWPKSIPSVQNPSDHLPIVAMLDFEQ